MCTNNQDEINNKIAYLQMIQEPINRTSTISAIFKGFAATIVAGIATLSYVDISLVVLGLSFLPVIAFCILDIYYLKIEKKYRHLFEKVAKNKVPINFLMDINICENEKKEAHLTNWECIKSPSIYLFYPLMISILIVIFVLKCCCKI